MITIGLIRNGSNYLSHHLRKNDYWAEGEKEVQGEWIGLGAELLGLSGAVTDEPFEALRENINPLTGKSLTPRRCENRVAFFDIQLSAPKDVSVLAMVGGDERVREAFVESVKITLREMEHYAAVRERRGEKATSEEYNLTGNILGAMFLHDTSRDLDPQLHAHAVLTNASWSETRKQWLALKQNEMLRASPYLRQVLYRELADRLNRIGYETYGMSSTGFSIRGVEHLRERFSKRTRHVHQLAEEFAQTKGRRPTAGEVEVLVRNSRGSKLTEVTTPEVRTRQRAELSVSESSRLDELVAGARKRGPRILVSQGETQAVLQSALDQVFERTSVTREGNIFAAALELYPRFTRWRELRAALESHDQVIHRKYEVTLSSVVKEEVEAVRLAMDNRNTRFDMGEAKHLPESLTPGQRLAAQEILASHDFLNVLIGDAGTGKTTVLSAIEASHVASGGDPFLTFAPTTRARDALLESGFKQATTVQQFLVNKEMQTQAYRRVVLVDEAGLLSTKQLDHLLKTAHGVHARVLLVGDPKQHYSVERGDALRNIVKKSRIPVVRLSEVLRQRSHKDRRFSELIAEGEASAAFDYADDRGMIQEVPDDHALFAKAAEHYASNLKKGIDTLVVIPFWAEIEFFNSKVRPALRTAGLLGEQEILREAVKPLSWTAERKSHWEQYRTGDRLLFARETRHFKRGMAAEVVEVLTDGLKVCGPNGLESKINKRHCTTYDVGRAQKLALSVGDKILIRGRNDKAGFKNGDFKEIARIEPETYEVVFTDGKTLPSDFAAWTYGHAVTSYRSQGSTSEESLLVLGEIAAKYLSVREFYVGNTRYRGSHKIYVSNKEEILERIRFPNNGRELATEFVQRTRIVQNQQLSPTPRISRNEYHEVAIRAAEKHRRRIRYEHSQRMRI